MSNINNEDRRRIIKKLQKDKKNGRELLEREEMLLSFKATNFDSELSYKAEPKQFGDSIVLTPRDLDTEYHSPRSLRVFPGDYGRTFWVNILIASSGKEIRSSECNKNEYDRSTSKLENTSNDLDAFIEFYRPPMVGDPWVVSPLKLKSEGFFQITKKLCNPSVFDLEWAIKEIKKWVKINTKDPEFTSIQVNLCYAGHGFYSSDMGNSSIELADDFIFSDRIAELIHDILPPTDLCENRHRLDIFLDCCHAGAIALHISKEVLKLNNEKLLKENLEFDKEHVPIGGIGIGRLFCSCLHDEKSIENNKLGHGLFTYAFLNEYSTKKVLKDTTLNLALRDVGWYSRCKQHPFFISFLAAEHPNKEDHLIKFPSLIHLRNPNFKAAKSRLSLGKIFVKIIKFLFRLFNRFRRDSVITIGGEEMNDIFFKILENHRSLILDSEKKIRNSPPLRIKFNRQEYFKREIHWF